MKIENWITNVYHLYKRCFVNDVWWRNTFLWVINVVYSFVEDSDFSWDVITLIWCNIGEAESNPNIKILEIFQSEVLRMRRSVVCNK